MSKKFPINEGIIDSHCDTVHYFTGVKGNYDFLNINNMAQLDLPRMEAAGLIVQFFALYIEPEHKPAKALKRCLQLLDSFYRTVEPCYERLEVIHSYNDLLRVNKERKIAVVLTVEGGEALEGEIAVLRMLFRLGIRVLGLTWNQRNEIADGVGERQTGGGLTRFGKKVIEEMNSLGMIIDLAHIAEKGFFDVLMLSSTPVIVSHANARKICNHHRNLTDQQLRALKENGGVVGISLYPAFIHEDTPNLEILLNHFEHIAEVAGIDHLGIGTDFDGMEGKALKELSDVSSLHLLVEGLRLRGFKENDLNKILFENYLRVIKEIM